MASHMEAPGQPTVGNELNDAIGGLSANAGTLEQLSSPGGLSGQLANDNTLINLTNIANLTQASAAGGGLADIYTQRAMYEGNQVLKNAYNQTGAYVNPLTQEQLNANPFLGESSNVAGNFLGAGVNAGMAGIAGEQNAIGLSGSPALSLLGGSMAIQGAGVNPVLSSIAGRLAGNPISAGTQQLSDTAMSQLALGGSISSQESDMVSQASRAADSARGIFNSNASASNELLNLDQFSQQRLLQREQAAGSAAGIYNSELNANLTSGANVYNTGLNTALGYDTGAASAFGTDLSARLSGLSGAAGTLGAGIGYQQTSQNMGLGLLSQLLNTGTNAVGNSFNSIQQAMYNGPSVGSNFMGSTLSTMYGGTANPTPVLFNSMGLGSMAQDNAMTGYNGAFASREMNAQANNSLTGGIISGVSNVLGSLLGSVGKMCWVAREVFDGEGPEFREFRQWMLNGAADELFEFYLKNGEEIAEDIKDQPQVKELIKHLMQAIIRR